MTAVFEWPGSRHRAIDATRAQRLMGGIVLALHPRRALPLAVLEDGSLAADAPPRGPRLIHALVVVLTFYCGGRCCVGSNAEHGLTKAGTRPVEGRTVAADPRLFPIGTRLWIEGLGERVVQDVGSGVKGAHLDVYVGDHQRALRLGRRQARVRVLHHPAVSLDRLRPNVTNVMSGGVAEPLPQPFSFLHPAQWLSLLHSWISASPPTASLPPQDL